MLILPRISFIAVVTVHMLELFACTEIINKFMWTYL